MTKVRDLTMRIGLPVAGGTDGPGSIPSGAFQGTLNLGPGGPSGQFVAKPDAPTSGPHVLKPHGITQGGGVDPSSVSRRPKV